MSPVSVPVTLGLGVPAARSCFIAGTSFIVWSDENALSDCFGANKRFHRQRRFSNTLRRGRFSMLIPDAPAMPRVHALRMLRSSTVLMNIQNGISFSSIDWESLQCVPAYSKDWVGCWLLRPFGVPAPLQGGKRPPWSLRLPNKIPCRLRHKQAVPSIMRTSGHDSTSNSRRSIDFRHNWQVCRSSRLPRWPQTRRKAILRRTRG